MKTFSPESMAERLESGTIYNDGRIHIYFSVHSGTRSGKEVPLAGISVTYRLPLLVINDKPSETSVLIAEGGEARVRYVHEEGSTVGVTPWSTSREALAPHLPTKIVAFCDRMAPMVDQVVRELRQ